MEKNPIWIPIIGLLAASGAGVYGYSWLTSKMEDREAEVEAHIEEQQQQQTAAMLSAQVQREHMFEQLKPMMWLSIPLGIGIGAALMLKNR